MRGNFTSLRMIQHRICTKTFGPNDNITSNKYDYKPLYEAEKADKMRLKLENNILKKNFTASERKSKWKYHSKLVKKKNYCCLEEFLKTGKSQDRLTTD